MSREIKFRAWNGEQMISPDYIDREGVAHWKENSIPEMASGDKVMQYTGLRDKHGKEIYEGDVVRFCLVETFVVEWEHSQPTSGYNFYGWNMPSVKDMLTCEVIGNVHENPELIP